MEYVGAFIGLLILVIAAAALVQGFLVWLADRKTTQTPDYFDY